MSASPQHGEDEWPRRGAVLPRGMRVAHSVDDAAFAASFERSAQVIPLHPGFHVHLPKSTSCYFGVCYSGVFAFVPAHQASSVHLMVGTIQARRPEFFVYTSLLSGQPMRKPRWTGRKWWIDKDHLSEFPCKYRPERAGDFATEWWRDKRRALPQPLQDAMCATGSDDVAVYMAKITFPRAQGPLWVAIWRMRGGLYTCDMLQSVCTSGREVVAQLAAQLRRVGTGLVLSGVYEHYSLAAANPEPQFPKTGTADTTRLVGALHRTAPSPLTKVPMVQYNGRAVAFRGFPHEVATVHMRPHGKVCINIIMPAAIECGKFRKWQYVIGAEGTGVTVSGVAHASANEIDVEFLTAAWGHFARKSSNPWFDLRLETDAFVVELPIPRYMQTDFLTGYGRGSSGSELIRTCVLMTHAEFVELDRAVASTAVIAAFVLDEADVVPRFCMPVRPARRRAKSGRRAAQIRNNAALVSSSADCKETLNLFASVATRATHRVVAAALGRLAELSATNDELNGPTWSVLLAACARRMHRLSHGAIDYLVQLLCTPPLVSPGDNNELLAVIAALRNCGMNGRAERVEELHSCGQLVYMVRWGKLPLPVRDGAKCVISKNQVGVILKLIAAEYGEQVFDATMNAFYARPQYQRLPGPSIVDKAHSRAAERVVRAIPSQRKRLAAAAGLLALEANAVRKSARQPPSGWDTEYWDVMPSLVTAQKDC